ncbi:hypothetical protein NC653_038142 [Populus alba x Populus x berolinensis]|uniref:Uncharacterized protein n=1 Tax=Populus alba x Populus x berolinensis TaxID=444605 RepID=A0AAD6LGG8_9ROSI|nr:hypothetical protein NC653_038142 [Populus alba x Populus x berolinensis]
MQPFENVNKWVSFPFFERFGENCRLDGSYFLFVGYEIHIKKVAKICWRKFRDYLWKTVSTFASLRFNFRDPKSNYSNGQSQRDLLGMNAENSKILRLNIKFISVHFKKEEIFPYKKRPAEENGNRDYQLNLLGRISHQGCAGNQNPRQGGNPRPQQKEDGHERHKGRRVTGGLTHLSRFMKNCDNLLAREEKQEKRVAAVGIPQKVVRIGNHIRR